MDETKKSLIKGYTALLLCCCTYIGLISAIQAIGNKTSIFEINALRFFIEFVVAVVIVLNWKYSVKIEKKDIYKLALGIMFKYIFFSIFFLASIILPGGNMEGIYGGLYITLATFVDVLRRKISALSVAASMLAIAGVVLLAQPWHLAMKPAGTLLVPCDYIENTANETNSSLVEFNRTLSESPVEQSVQHLLLGYLYLFVATICIVGGNNFYREILQVYSIYTLLFWSAISHCICSLIITVTLKLLKADHMTLPTSATCLGFLFLFILFGIGTRMSTNLACKYLPVSKLAIATPVSTVGLYIFQKTVMKAFYPGHANVLEIVGIVIVFIAAILSPLVTIFKEHNLLKNGTADGEKENLIEK